MIAYVTLGTNDLVRAAAFYDALLAEVGAKRVMEDARYVVWGRSADAPMLGLFIPHDGQPASAGNGTMVALARSTTEQVDALYARAIALGATDEGRPGLRGARFYCGYFRDPDGNKLNAFCMAG